MRSFKGEKDGIIEEWDCPTCGKATIGYPALSRKDNKTYICTHCGIAEAIVEIEVPTQTDHCEEAQNDIDMERGRW